MKRRYFLSAISASAIFQAQISPAENGGIKGTSLFFKSPKQPLIDIQASTGFFNPNNDHNTQLITSHGQIY